MQHIRLNISNFASLIPKEIRVDAADNHTKKVLIPKETMVDAAEELRSLSARGVDTLGNNGRCSFLVFIQG